jgi:hypothetical protein
VTGTILCQFAFGRRFHGVGEISAHQKNDRGEHHHKNRHHHNDVNEDASSLGSEDFFQVYTICFCFHILF